jgi:hypothetical protein
MHTITHADGTVYRVERRANGRYVDLYFVYSKFGYERVYAISEEEAVTKARAEYAKFLLEACRYLQRC